MASGSGPGRRDPSTPTGTRPAERFDRPAGYDEPGRHEEGAGRAGQAVSRSRRHRDTPETKEFIKTSEFMVWGATVVGLMLAGLISENLFSEKVWLYTAIVSAAYILSRGLAKAASRPEDADRGFASGH